MNEGRKMTRAIKLRTERSVLIFSAVMMVVSIAMTHLVLHFGLAPEDHLGSWKLSTFISGSLAFTMSYFSGKVSLRSTRLAEELAYLAQHDPLTGTISRRHFFELAGKPEAYPAAVILIDLDRFKTVNDRYGHAGGDEALRHLAQVLRTGLGPRDVLARLGGEEFVVLVPGADEEAGARLAQGLLSLLRKSPAIVQAEQLTLTASFGVSVAEGPGGIDHAVHRADLAMYEAKAQGRAQVCRSSSLAPPSEDRASSQPLTVEPGLRPRVRQSPRGQTH